MIDAAAGAEELEGVGDPSHVELHRVRVDPDRDRTVLHQPRRHLSLVLGHAHAACDRGFHLEKLFYFS